ncbi:transcriptional regulator [Granulicatella sp. zg-ZJ]|uniref:LCP family glycopolymer transferase n=1 Tax=unclassified Granulicatella TaxID=2630493 RepID=UPI0013C14DC0|nr:MULTISPECIES: LCP family protein [unclassified Granulicatella]MBS4750372.1 LCP family protein [Carnobacteriaceae bacterium zg-ZUI78]NEW63250.1 transcriptional regulator [Granulicatella sp. zg-ZJ]NEW65986.1 transcriptional regulator [Granulicatella sp. zg-84]QMI85870.1 LCP family protein [Carnobacteriaceae bacterium zg-84]
MRRKKSDFKDPYYNESLETLSRTTLNETRKRKKKRKRRLIWLTVLLVLLGGATIYGFDVWNSFKTAVNKTTHEVKKDNLRSEALKKRDPFSVLLVGIDQGGEYGYSEDARADTLVLATINPETNTTTLASIPRDAYAKMKVSATVENGLWDKINHSYAYGGIKGTIDTVQQYLQVPIDSYIRIDIDGLMDLVDKIGGIDVVSPITFSQEGYNFVEGESIHLDGFGANVFARMRMVDPEGTAGREGRQRTLITALAKKLLSANTLFNYKNILDTISSHVQTDLTFDRLLEIQRDYSSALTNMKQESFEAFGVDIQNGYYGLVTDTERLRVSNILRKELKLNPITQQTFIDKDISLSQDNDIYHLYNSVECIDANGNSVECAVIPTRNAGTYTTENETIQQTVQQTVEQTIQQTVRQSVQQPLVTTTNKEE